MAGRLTALAVWLAAFPFEPVLPREVSFPSQDPVPVGAARRVETARPLTLWHAYRGGEEQALERASSGFMKTTGVPVKLLAVPYDVFASKLISAIAHGQGPDVFIFSHPRLASFKRLGLVAPSDGFIERAAYLPNTVSALQEDGQTFGYPLSLKCLALYVNSDLVARAPATTRELLDLLSKLSLPEDNRFGLAYEAGNFYYHAPILFGFGGKLFDERGKAAFDTPALARSISFVRDLQDSRFIPREASGALVKSLFNSGRAAMVISGPWFAGEIGPSVRYRIAALPMVNETGFPMSPFLEVEAAFVSARSRHSQAQAFARFLSLEEASLIRVSVGRQIPADKATYVSSLVRRDPFMVSFQEVARRAVPMPGGLEMSRVWEPMKLALNAALQGNIPPERAGSLADRRYRALYREPSAPASPWPYALCSLVAFGGAARRLRRQWPAGVFAKRYPKAMQAFIYVAPAAAGIFVLVLIPFGFGLGLSLFHHDGGRYAFVGLGNFVDILTSRHYRITEPMSFYFTLAVTTLWTLLNVALHVSIGLALALALQSPLVRLKGLCRVILILPWAIPNYITALLWKGMFHTQLGAVNGLLACLGVEPISWFSRFSTAFAANVVANTWLGFPFMMVVAMGSLQSIPRELYEAAEVDGASAWGQFRRITLPLLRPTLFPAVVLGIVWTFNMFNIIYLVSGGEPGGGTDILVSEAFRWAFQRNEQYGFAAAYSALIFLILLGYSLLMRRLSRRASAAAS